MQQGHQLSNQPALTPASLHSWRSSLVLDLPPTSSINQLFFVGFYFGLIVESVSDGG